MKNEANQFIRKWGASYLSFYKLSDAHEDAAEASVKARLFTQLGQFIGRTHDFDTTAEEVATAPETGFDPLIYWSNHAGELSLVAKALLSVTASEAAVERSFSAQGAVHTKKRNRLLDQSVQTEMFVKFNSAALNKDVHRDPPRPTLVDLSLDIDFAAAANSESEHDSETDAGEEDPVIVLGMDGEEIDEQAAAAASPSSSGAAAAAASSSSEPRAPVRSRSELDAAVRTFLEAYIDSHLITLTNCRRWNSDRRNALEVAIISYREEHGAALCTTDDGIEAIKAILNEQNE